MNVVPRAIVDEVRQCLTDGKPEHADQVLRRGLASPGADPVLEGLRLELTSERNYREEFRKARLLFGRRRLMYAEGVLGGLLSQNRPAAQALQRKRTF